MPPNCLLTFNLFYPSPIPVNSAYKDGAGGRAGLDLTVRQGAPRACQVGAALATWAIASAAAEVAVCSQGLSGAVAHLQRKKAAKGSPQGCDAEMLSVLELSAAMKKKKDPASKAC